MPLCCDAAANIPNFPHYINVTAVSMYRLYHCPCQDKHFQDGKRIPEDVSFSVKHCFADTIPKHQHRDIFPWCKTVLIITIPAFCSSRVYRRCGTSVYDDWHNRFSACPLMCAHFYGILQVEWPQPRPNATVSVKWFIQFSCLFSTFLCPQFITVSFIGDTSSSRILPPAYCWVELPI